MADQHHLSQLKLPYLKRLAEKLDPKTTIGHDWRDVADGLGFTMDSIRHVESTSQGSSPTIQVLNLCSHRENFTVGRLREVFHEVERHDCVSILDEAAEELQAVSKRRSSPSAVEHDDRYQPASMTSSGQVSLAQSQNDSLRSEPVESEDMDDGQSLSSRAAQDNVWVRQQPSADKSWQQSPQSFEPPKSAAMLSTQNCNINSLTGMMNDLSSRGQSQTTNMDGSVTSGISNLNIRHGNGSVQCGGLNSGIEAGGQMKCGSAGPSHINSNSAGPSHMNGNNSVGPSQMNGNNSVRPSHMNGGSMGPSHMNGNSAGPQTAHTDQREQYSSSFDYGAGSAPSPSYPYSPSSRGDQGLSTDILTSEDRSQADLPPIGSFIPSDTPRTLTSHDYFPPSQQYPPGQHYMGQPHYNPPAMNGQQNVWMNGGARPKVGYVGPRQPYARGMDVPQYNNAMGGGRGHPYVACDQPIRLPQRPPQPVMNSPYRPNPPPVHLPNRYPPPTYGQQLPYNSMNPKANVQNGAMGPSSESGVSSAPDSFRVSGSNTGTSRNVSSHPQVGRAISMPPDVCAGGGGMGVPGAAMQNGVPPNLNTRSLSVNYPPTTPDPLSATAERIFITYSRDSEVHLMRVLDMAKKLFAEGFFVEVDMFERHFAGIDKMGWLDNRIKKAAFVIIICSPQYMTDVEKQSDCVEGLHTLYIHRSLQTEYLDNKACNYRFIPILFDGFSRDCVPRWLHNTTIFYWPKDIQDIMARLRRQERFSIPDIGKPPSMRRNPDNT